MTEDRLTPASFTGFVTVRLRAEGDPGSKAKTLAEHVKRNGLAGIGRALGMIGNPPSTRLITAIPAAKLLEMERAAAQGEFPPLRSLTQYWRIDLRARDPEETARALTILRGAREIELVEEEEVALPAVYPDDDPLQPLQEYQDWAPVGIDAEWMWAIAQADGTGVGVVDIEGGWLVTHEDLVAKAPTIIFGDNNPSSSWQPHGTAVLGVIAAADNGLGVVGIAPGISSLRMSSIYNPTLASQNVPNAVAFAIGAMTVGEIMLIEVQTGGLYPQETSDAILDLFRLATSQGILVVEAAGNGNHDFDTWFGSGGNRLNRTSPDFVDSGALMVGESVWTVPHDRRTGLNDGSNYGSRLDCYAWGERVATCAGGDLQGGAPEQLYTAYFAGTSSAAAIIVGAAALVQSYYLAAEQTPMSPTQLRMLLSDPSTGTPQGPGVAGAIGVMPNLRAIVWKLGYLPDVYVRDAVGDTGLVPWLGNICTSPDIIVRPATETDPQAAWGQGSALQDSSTLGEYVVAQKENYVYVRVRNRGAAPAPDVVATVYWSEVATMPTPSMWHLIGSTTIPSVWHGDILTVSGPITWPAAQVPALGHYCFVATLDHPKDPVPIDPVNFPAMSAADYHDLIRNQNNVTWRNFNVVDALPPSDGITFPFDLTGAEVAPEPFHLEFERRLPRDARLILEGPTALIRQLRKAGKELAAGRGGTSRLTLPSRPRIALGEVRLGGPVRHSCRLIVIPGKEKIQSGHGASIRQLFRGEEIGRVTWQFAPRPRRQKG